MAHRITKIIEKVGDINWHHVDSATNPADLAGRGVPAQELVGKFLLGQGPAWLQENKQIWPTINTDFTTNIEEKHINVICV